MGTFAAGRLLASNVTSGGGDGVTTPGATGGEANHTLIVGEIPSITPTATLTNPGASLSVPTIVNTVSPTFSGFLVTPTWSATNSYGGIALSSTATFATGAGQLVASGSAQSVSSTSNASVVTNLPSYTPTGTVSSFTPGGSVTAGTFVNSGGSVSLSGGSVAVSAFGGGLPHNVKDPFILGTWYVKL